MIRGRSWGRRRRVAAAPAFDNSAVGPNNTNGQQTLSLTVGPGGNKTVLAALLHLNPGAGNPTATCGGVPMSFVGKAGQGSTQSYIALLRLDNVAPGTYSIVLATGENYSLGMATSYSGVASSAGTPILGQGSNGPASTGAQTIAPNETLVTFLQSRLTPTVTSGTTRRSIDHSSGFNFGRIIEGAGASPQTNSVTTGNAWAMASLKLAA